MLTPREAIQAKKERKALTEEIRSWIESFNKERGWKSYTVPNPEGSGRQKSPEKLYRERQAFDPAVLQKAIGDGHTALAAARTALAAEADETKREQLADTIEDLQAQLVEDETKLGYQKKAQDNLDRIAEAKGNLDSDAKKIEERIEQLSRQVEAGKEVKVDKSNVDAIKRFYAMHRAVEYEIEKARKEVITLTAYVKDTNGDEVAVDRTYAAISSDDYQKLFGLLEVAMLTFQTGDIGKAQLLVEATRKRLTETVLSRVSLDQTQKPDTLHDALDGVLSETASVLSANVLSDPDDALYFQAAGQGLKDRLAALRKAITKDIKDNKAGFVDKRRKEIEAVRDDALTIVGKSARIDRLLEAAQGDADAMRLNGHTKRPERVEKRLADYRRGGDADVALAEAQKIRDFAAEKLADTLKMDMGGGPTPEEMNADLTELRSKFDEWFKHNKDGTVKTQKDSQTQQDKGVKKNRHLPREAIEEAELRMSAADQLLKSGSAEALRQAVEHLEGARTFIEKVDSDPDFYKKIQDKLRRREKALNSVESKFGAYEVSERFSLKEELNRLKDNFATVDASEVEADVAKLKTDIEAFRSRMSELRGKKRALAARADLIDNQITELEHLLVDDVGKYHGVELSEYKGRYRDDMVAVRDRIAKRTKTELDGAETDLDTLETNVGTALRQLKDYIAAKPADRAARLNDVRYLLRDARDGQNKAKDDADAKDGFVKGKDKLKDDISTQIKSLDKVRGDTSGFKALEAERKALSGRITKSESYVEGQTELEGLKKRYEELVGQAAGAIEVAENDLGEAAKKCVKRVSDLRKYISDFMKTKVEPAGVNGGSNDLDNFDRAKLTAFFSVLVKALDKDLADAFAAASAKVADSQLDRKARLAARKDALRHLHRLMGVITGFAPLDAFVRGNPFDSGGAGSKLVGSLRQMLPRLEVKILTSIKE